MVIQNNKFWFFLSLFPFHFSCTIFRPINIKQKNVIDFFSVNRQSVLTEHKRQTCTHIVFTLRFRFSCEYAHTYTHSQYCISSFHLVRSQTIKQCLFAISIIRYIFSEKNLFHSKVRHYSICHVLCFSLFAWIEALLTSDVCYSLFISNSIIMMYRIYAYIGR